MSIYFSKKKKKLDQEKPSMCNVVCKEGIVVFLDWGLQKNPKIITEFHRICVFFCFFFVFFFPFFLFFFPFFLFFFVFFGKFFGSQQKICPKKNKKKGKKNKKKSPQKIC